MRPGAVGPPTAGLAARARRVGALVAAGDAGPGTVLITLSSQVKLPSLLALGFVAMALARRWGGTLKAVLVARRLADARCRWR